ncbi:hypothetical protein HMPREF9444_01635 [Succinatimonas hippei YIT 12066]|uniref:Uncharacterized protein n=1 Tax=Succinatimonas hippei (strain DSM 22608 / JCM 16073 / KCTC 15190 / YIT 12066) TaxID=762983 RepID=E8LLL8_SUCHY|nr:hypothetical protein HMPREF9444_01635 [Succinatimonas hippei YIT 12066]
MFAKYDLALKASGINSLILDNNKKRKEFCYEMPHYLSYDFIN